MPITGVHTLLIHEPKRVDMKSKLRINIKGAGIRSSFLKVVHTILNFKKGVF